MNRRNLVCLCGLILAALACASAPPVPQVEDAVVVAGKAARFNFGEVFQGEPVRASFVIVNPAPYRIEIEKVVDTCGCTTSLFNTGLLTPGESRLLVAELDTSRLWGPQGKTILIRTNDPYRRTIRLTIEGMVRERLLFEPRRVRTVVADGAAAAAVRVTNNTTVPLTIAGLEVDPVGPIQAAFAGTTLPLTLAAGESTTLEVQAQLTRPAANLVGHVRLLFAGSGAPVDLPLYFERLPEPKPEDTESR